MTNCWSEGELRACLDRALPEPDLEAVRQHLEECPACARRSAALAERAARVSMLMGTLADGANHGAPRPAPVLATAAAQGRRRRWTPSWRWTGVPAAVAAAVTLAFLLAPSRTPRNLPGTPQVAARTAPAPDRDPVMAPPAEPVPAPPVRPRRTVSQKAETRPNAEYYLALDDEPIDTGVVMRVAFGGGDLQADVIFDSQGRPRAIRPVR
jgi:anti-sigma factor RsiW